GAARVAGGRGDEDPRVGGEHEGHLVGGHDILRRAGDGVVDDVHAVGGGVVDGGDQAGRGAAAVAVRGHPQGLVDGDVSLRGHARGGPQVRAHDAQSHTVVARSRAGSVRSVTVAVTGRLVLAGDDRVAVVRAVPACPDDLVVALEVATLVHAGDLARAGPVGRRVWHPLGGEARVVGVDAGVDDADDHAFPGVLDATELGVPDAVLAGQTEVVRGLNGVRVADLVLPDVEHAGSLLHVSGLDAVHLHREAVERYLVGRHDVGRAHASRLQRLGALLAQVALVGVGSCAVDVDLLAGLRSGGREALAAVERHQRVIGQLDDVGLGLTKLKVWYLVGLSRESADRQRGDHDRGSGEGGNPR